MEFNELITGFAAIHNVADLVPEENTAALDIDGIVVSLSANEDLLTLSAEIGEPPADEPCVFADLLLEANLQSDVFFAKTPEGGPYLIVRRLGLPPLNGEAFDAALESFVNQTETWRLLLADFRPAARAATARDAAVPPTFGTTGFMPV